MEPVEWTDCSNRRSMSDYHVVVSSVKISELEPHINSKFTVNFRGVLDEGTLKKPKSYVQLMRQDNKGKWKKLLPPFTRNLCSLSMVTCPIETGETIEFEISRNVPSLLSSFLNDEGVLPLRLIAVVKEGSSEVGCIQFDTLLRK